MQFFDFLSIFSEILYNLNYVIPLLPSAESPIADLVLDRLATNLKLTEN